MYRQSENNLCPVGMVVVLSVRTSLSYFLLTSCQSIEGKPIIFLNISAVFDPSQHNRFWQNTER